MSIWKRLGLALLVVAALYGVVTATPRAYSGLVAWVSQQHQTAGPQTAGRPILPSSTEPAPAGEPVPAGNPSSALVDAAVTVVPPARLASATGLSVAAEGVPAVSGVAPSSQALSSLPASPQASRWVHIHLLDYTISPHRRGLLGGNPSGYFVITIRAGHSTLRLRSPNSDAWMELQADGFPHLYELEWWVLLPPGAQQAAVQVQLWQRHHLAAEEVLASGVVYLPAALLSASQTSPRLPIPQLNAAATAATATAGSTEAAATASAAASFNCEVSVETPPQPEAIPKGALASAGPDPATLYKLGVDTERTLSGWGLRVSRVNELSATAHTSSPANRSRIFSPAQMIGLASGDIITSIDGQLIRSPADLDWVKAHVQDRRAVQIRFVPASAPELQVVALTQFVANG